VGHSAKLLIKRYSLMKDTISPGNFILIDAHVHIHDCFDPDKSLDSAQNNFKIAASDKFKTENFTGVLLLTESSGADKFKYLKEKSVKDERKDKWNFVQTFEENSIVAQKNEKDKIVIIAGRQIVSKEKLEVLGLGIVDKIDDGLPIEAVVNGVTERGGLAVIPWGVGKWFGSKGKIVKKLIQDQKFINLFVGDNGNRPFFWPKSKIIKEQENKNVLNFSGSDPLPFKNEFRKPGSFGFAFESSLNFNEPFKSIKMKITGGKVKFIYFGKLESSARFVKNQLLMQIKKKAAQYK
jgi:hypothetical protein